MALMCSHLPDMPINRVSNYAAGEDAAAGTGIHASGVVLHHGDLGHQRAGVPLAGNPPGLAAVLAEKVAAAVGVDEDTIGVARIALHINGEPGHHTRRTPVAVWFQALPGANRGVGSVNVRGSAGALAATVIRPTTSKERSDSWACRGIAGNRLMLASSTINQSLAIALPFIGRYLCSAWAGPCLL